MAALVAAAPARALEMVQLQLPILQTSFTIKLGELSSPQRLLQGSSDLAQLNRALNGRIGQRLGELIQTPLPIDLRSVVGNAQGNPLVEQVQLLTSTLVRVDGVSEDGSTAERDSQLLAAALASLPRDQPVTLLSLLKAIPGRSATIDLERALADIHRVQRQQQRAQELVVQLPPVSSDRSLASPGPLQIQTTTALLPVTHRSVPLVLDLVSPTQGGNGRLVVISHGLWDSPVSFLGWADQLASHGYTVILPHHPGSDNQQQRAMLAGTIPPPGPEELRKRPLDIKAVIDAVAAGTLPGLRGVRSDRVVVIGHSWGATTALQLAGAQPSAARLEKRCGDLNDPDRNLSWVLQCSFLSSADRAALADARVIAVAAVSPMKDLLFDTGAAQGMQARGLLISGTSDWVVPSGPEALHRFDRLQPQGHQLVLVRGGDHFNLRGPRGSMPVLAPLLLAWTDAAFTTPAMNVKPSSGARPLLTAGGWGNTERVMVDASAATP